MFQQQWQEAKWKRRRQMQGRRMQHHFKEGFHSINPKASIFSRIPCLLTTFQMSGTKSTDVMLEIGLGTGNLTKKLLECGKMVIAVRIDLQTVLEFLFKEMYKTELPYLDICVANIPYQISSPLTFKLLNHQPSFPSAIIMFHRWGDSGQPGDKIHCRLTVDSSVEPMEPRIEVKQKEWDGFLIICSIQENKTFCSIIRQKSAISLLEKKYKTFCALNVLQQDFADNDDGDFDYSRFDDSNEDQTMKSMVMEMTEDQNSLKLYSWA
uniref:rRNA adenine N(6)-methyltransferase n=1 Tax=Cucumis sativus TaxID=3659 RepID=A0A0A0KYM8_CUCSA